MARSLQIFFVSMTSFILSSLAMAQSYSVVFPQDRIAEFKIIIKPTDWAAMQENMRQLYGEPGKPPSRPPGGGGGEMPGFPKEKPMWVRGEIVFAGKTWSNVAIRYKGNSSLIFSWMRGTEKLPFKIDFTKFESKKRKFHGFSELSLSNNFADETYLREPLAYRLLEDMGLPASHTALYRVIVDHGAGEKDYGIYTSVEVTNDTVVKNFFGEDEGNIYEGDGQGATLAKGITVEQLKAAYQKENNKKENDWSDVIDLYNILHSPQRLSQASRWRTELEERFEVKDFLKWLAMAAVLEHWDTYGGLPHNFYLYNDGGKLHWISWDHNLILGAGFGGPPTKPPFVGEIPPIEGRIRSSTSFDRKEVKETWPLIRFLLDDPAYSVEYKAQLKDMRSKYFNAAKIERDLRERSRMIRQSVETSKLDAFDKRVDELIKKIYERQQKLEDHLKTL